MKQLIAIGLVTILLLGCTPKDDAMDALMSFREELINSSDVSFEAEITADYGEDYYTFSMFCSMDSTGSISFTVTEPETIRDIRGNVRSNEGELTFDDQVLTFDTMASGRISPVSAPYVLMQALRGGYISAVSKQDDGFCAMIDDSYADDALNLEVIFRNNIPVRGEIFYEQRRILTLQLDDFQLM